MVAIGSSLGHYVVERALSSGGMSDALLARSPAGRLVVLKKPRTNDPELAARLRDEARLGARIYHAQLVETLDAFEHEGSPVLVLGYVEGPTLDDLRKQTPMSPASAARIGCHVAEALGAIHDAIGDDGQPMRALHRDVTARNIVVTHGGDGVLIDLGIARFDEARIARTETGMVLGTLRYMAPEVVDGDLATVASDFYSLGCVIIEACTGNPVFTGPPSLITSNIVTQGPMPKDVAAALPPALRDVVARMVARRPAERMKAAHEVSSALRTVEAQLGGGQASLAALARAYVAPPPVQAAQSAQVGLASMAVTNVDVAAPFVPVAAPFMPTIERAPLRASAPPSLLAGAPLELAIEPRSRAKQPEPLRDRAEFYPTVKSDWRWLTDSAKTIVVVIALLAAAGLAWRWYDEEQRAEDQRAVEEKVSRETDLLQKALADTPVDCSSEGGFWLYKDKRGAPVVVDSIGKVPKKYRGEARCVKATR